MPSARGWRHHQLDAEVLACGLERLGCSDDMQRGIEDDRRAHRLRRQQVQLHSGELRHHGDEDPRREDADGGRQLVEQLKNKPSAIRVEGFDLAAQRTEKPGCRAPPWPAGNTKPTS